MKRIFAFAVGALLVLMTACSDVLQTEKLGGIHTDGGDVYPEKVATLDGEAVSFDEFRYYYLNYRDLYLSKDKNAFSDPAAEERLKEEVLDNLLSNRAVRLLAGERGISLSPEEKKAAKAEIEETVALYGKDELIEKLHASYMSQQLYRETASFTKLYQKLYDSFYGENGTDSYSDGEFLAYYRENYLAVQEIYLPYARGEKAGDCPGTLAKAQTVLAAYNEGADFMDLMEEYGEDPGMELEPDGYYITEGEAEDVLYQAGAALAENELSQPVEAAAGVYILRRVPIKDEKALKRKADVLEGYEDGAGNRHSGVYEDLFLALLREKGKTISVVKEPVWEEISSDTVF